MRILQLIDSLEAGGAERMAVNYANELVNKIEFSGLVVSRKEGILCDLVNKNVNYLFLNRKKILDFTALSLLKAFVKNNKIEIVHAHGTSYFLAFLLKLFCFRIKIVWHEHYGARAKQSNFQNLSYQFCSLFFSMVLLVNNQLKQWANKKLFTKKNHFLPNFSNFDESVISKTILKGENDKRIILLANLKNPKNHIFALHAFFNSKIYEQGWSLHFVGKDFNDDYSKEIIDFIKNRNIEDFIFLYDAQSDVKNILAQATIGILTSLEEGFPVTILEYGEMELPVIVTDVGYCNELIDHNYDGYLINSESVAIFQSYLIKMTSDFILRKSFALNLQKKILSQYSKEKVINLLLKYYKTLYVQ